MDPDETENPGLNPELSHDKPKSSLSYRPQAAVKTGLKKKIQLELEYWFINPEFPRVARLLRSSPVQSLFIYRSRLKQPELIKEIKVKLRQQKHPVQKGEFLNKDFKSSKGLSCAGSGFRLRSGFKNPPWSSTHSVLNTGYQLTGIQNQMIKIECLGSTFNVTLNISDDVSS